MNNDLTMKEVKVPVMYLIAMGFFILTAPANADNQSFQPIRQFGQLGSKLGQLANPWRVTINPGNGDIFVADSTNNRIQIFTAGGMPKQVIGGQGTAEGEFSLPSAVEIVPELGNIVVTDTGNNRVQIFDENGRFLSTFGMKGNGPGQFDAPTGLAVTRNGVIYVADSGNNRIQKFDAAGNFLRSFGQRGVQEGNFQRPYDITIAPTEDRLAVADYGNNRVQLFDLDGNFLNTFGSLGTGRGEFSGVSAVAISRLGHIFVAEAANKRIQWFNQGGGYLGQFGSGGTGLGRFNQPHGLTLSRDGHQVIVSDYYGARIQVFSSEVRDALTGKDQSPVRSVISTFFFGVLILLLLGRTIKVRISVAHGSAHYPLLAAFQDTLHRAYTPELLLLLVALFNTVWLNDLFWEIIVGDGASFYWLGLISLGLLITFIHFFALLVFIPTRLVKIAVPLFLLISSTCSYFMTQYHVLFDDSMLRNVFATNWLEAKELITPTFLWQLTINGVLPAVIVVLIPLEMRSGKTGIIRRVRWLTMSTGLGVMLFIVAGANADAQLYAKSGVRYVISPGSAIASAAEVILSNLAPKYKRESISIDATINRLSERPQLLVIVVGESARAMSWGLNGYDRDTTPEMRKINAINFPQLTSCGSNTLTSMPCMFSPRGRHDYDEQEIRDSEGLLQILANVGYEVTWIGNQRDCIGVCADIFTINIAAQANAFCGTAACYDEQTLVELKKMLVRSTSSNDASGHQSNRVVVLHFLGSHGPGYFRRYPPAFKYYTPACKQYDLARCTPLELQNAYDNSIRYTDHLLAQAVGILQETETDSALLYTSDHGESLGEGGVYLHGSPYGIAPLEQIHVPMIFWVSTSFAQQRGIDVECVRRNAESPLTHATFFHTILGLLDVSTTVYHAKLDWVSNCRH